MPGVQRDAGAWDKFDEGTDSDDSSDSRVLRVNMGDASEDDKATPVGLDAHEGVDTREGFNVKLCCGIFR